MSARTGCVNGEAQESSPWTRRRPAPQRAGSISRCPVARRGRTPDEGPSADQQIVVALRYWRDLSLDEIAERLELPLGTVKSRLHYAMKALRRQLDRQGGEVSRWSFHDDQDLEARLRRISAGPNSTRRRRSTGTSRRWRMATGLGASMAFSSRPSGSAVGGPAPGLPPPLRPWPQPW